MSASFHSPCQIGLTGNKVYLDFDLTALVNSKDKTFTVWLLSLDLRFLLQIIGVLMKNCRLYASLNKVLRHCVGGAKFVDSFYLLSSWSDLSERYLAMHLPNVGVCLQFFFTFCFVFAECDHSNDWYF